MDGVADLEAVRSTSKYSGIVAGLVHGDLVHDVQHAAALDAGASPPAAEMHGDLHGDDRVVMTRRKSRCRGLSAWIDLHENARDVDGFAID